MILKLRFKADSVKNIYRKKKTNQSQKNREREIEKLYVYVLKQKKKEKEKEKNHLSKALLPFRKSSNISPPGVSSMVRP